MAGWFSLEAVYAKKGDALILHYGSKNNPKWILIDGGHTGVYDEFLLPRLDELRLQWPKRWNGDNRLDFEMVMVSHADADHLEGVLDLTAHMRRYLMAPGTPPPPIDCDRLWFNGFEDIIANNRVGVATVTDMAQTAGASGPGDLGLPTHLGRDDDLKAVVASTRQGRVLLQDAKKLVIDVNKEYGSELVMRGEGNSSITNFSPGLKLHLIAPDKRRVDKLRRKWKRDLNKILAKEKSTVDAAAFADSSAFNLSSIVVLASRGGKSMLLTGDARGDDIMIGLKEENLLKDGKIEVDLFKLPHHGSDRNVKAETFRDITARHYLVSANGEHGNPEPATLDMLVEGRRETRNDPYTLHITFPAAAFNLISEEAANKKKKLRKQKDALEAIDEWARMKKPDNMEIRYRDTLSRSIAVDLDSSKVLG